MGRKLPNEPQHGDLKANPAGGKEPETRLCKFPGRNLESTRPARKRRKKKRKKRKVIFRHFNISLWYSEQNKKQSAFLGCILSHITTHGCKVIPTRSCHVGAQVWLSRAWVIDWSRQTGGTGKQEPKQSRDGSDWTARKGDVFDIGNSSGAKGD